MAEWLSHVLLAYAAFTVASWQIEWLDQRWVAVGVVGSILPDLSRLNLLVDNDTMTALLGVPFEWGGLHTLGGSILLAGVGALLFEGRRQQYRAFGLLVAGAFSHLIVDLPQKYADGQLLTNLYLFPVSSWRGPTPGWYVSADRWVAVLSLGVALVVYLADRYRST